MAKINYNGKTLEEFTSDKPVFFDPPIKMYVTDDFDFICGHVESVIAYEPRRANLKAIGIHNSWRYCFRLPEKPTPRRATNRELAKWLAQGNGEYCFGTSGEKRFSSSFGYGCIEQDSEVSNLISVRKWDDTERHTPDAEYMGLEG